MIGFIIGREALRARPPRIVGMLIADALPPDDCLILLIVECPIGWLGARVDFLGLDVAADGDFALPDSPNR